ncbi:NIPSNAP domain containing protein [Rhizobium sp. R635]|uniref:NIPSNAP family protein n=1 Tax=unclassified Rhizobium TaxID=2613769 RepID=UPI000B536FFF|nr:NIPSNAP family protein [Rhizobium sp. R635]OWV87654.1 NIPSNAP domain containing protein [Rhizobium sp. R635]
MILEERDYRIKAGYVADFLENYQTLGLAVQREHLGEPHAFFVSDIGELNHVVSMWRYEDMIERAEKRAKMLADPRWPGYLASIKGLIDVQNIRILTPTAFSPLR